MVTAIGISAGPASAADVTPPTLTGISVVGQTGATPYSVNTTTGGGSVGITIAASDAGGSGLSEADVTVSCTTGCAGSGDNSEEGAAEFSFGVSSGRATASIQIPQTAQTGTWQVTEVVVADAANNTTDVTNLSAFTHRSFTVSHTADSTGPGLSGISFPGGVTSFDVTTHDADVSLLVHATDAVPGVASGAVTMTNGADELEFDFGSEDLQSGTLSNGTFQTSPQTLTYGQNGTWTVESITLTDGYGNTSTPSSSAQFHVTETADNAAPTTSGTPTLVPTSVNTTSSDATTTLSIHVTDAGTGFSSGFGELADPSFDTIDFFFDPSDLVSGTATDGVYSVAIDVPARQTQGTYSMSFLDLSDRAGNDGSVSSFTGWPKLAVTTTADSTGPQLGAFTASPSPLNLADNEERSLTLAATITDATSGFEHADVTMTDGGGNEVQATDLFDSTFTPHSGNNWIAQFAPADFGDVVAGTWHVTEVDLWDHAGNETVVTTGLPSFVVQTTNTHPDVTGPQVTAVSLTPASVSTASGDATVHGTVTISDAGTSGGAASGVSFGSISLTSPDGNSFASGGGIDPESLVSGNDTNGTYAFDMTIPQYSPTGTWQISDLDVVDNANNDTDLGAGQVAALGTSHVTVSGPVDTTHPTLTAVTASATTVNTTTSPHLTFQVTAADQDDAHDPGSGVSGGEVILTSPNGQTVEGDFSTFDGQVSGTPQSGTWSTDVSFPKFAQSGTWTVSVYLVDNLGNDVTYASTDIAALGGSNTSSVTVTGANDTKAPVATAIVFNPNPVNTTGGPTTLLVDVHLTDDQATSDGSGVGEATIDLASPHGTQPDFFADLQLVTGTTNDGWFEGSIDVPQFVDSGTWKISSLDVVDNENNEVDYNSAALTTAGLPTGVQITGSADTAAPTVTSLTPPSGTVDVRTSPQTISIPIGISDTNGSGGAGSGATFVDVTATGPHGAMVFGGADTPASGTATSGTWNASVTIPEFTDNGTWHITEVDTEDAFGNQAEITAFGNLPTAFTVESTPDTTPPAASGVTLSPTTADVSGGPGQITATISASDVGAGVDSGFIELSGPGGQSTSAGFSAPPTTGTANNGTFTTSLTIPRYAHAGSWTVDDLEILDAAGNSVDYSSSGTAFPFTPPSVAVTDSNPDTVAPTVAGIAISPSPIDLSGGLQQATFDFHTTDALSGTSDVSFVLTSPSGVPTEYDASSLASGTAQDGHWTAHVDFPVSSEDGTWRVTEVDTRDAAGNEASSSSPPATNTVTVKNGQPIAPSAPQGVEAVPGAASASLTWEAPDNGGSPITGYKVETTTNGGTSWSTPVSTGSTDPSYTATGLADGTTYQFRVAAVNSIGTGAYSAASNAITPTASAPGVPTHVTASAGNQQASLSWTAPASNGGSAITGYKVETSTNGGTSWSAPTSTGGTSASFTVNGLTNGTAYVFRVAAVNAIGTGDYSTASNAVTPAAVPNAPTGVSGVPGNQQVALSWTAPASNGGSAITGYKVESSTNGGTTWSTPTSTGGTNPSYTLGGLTNGTAYVFRVAAVNAVGTGAYSAASSAVTPATAPGTPTAVVGTPGDQQVALSWTAPGSNGGSAITGYKVESSTNGGTTWSTPTSTGSSSASFTVTGLTNGTAYVFRVAAVNALGTGSYSTASSAVTPHTVDGSSLTIGHSRALAFGKSVTIGTVLSDSVSGDPVSGASVALMSRRGTSGAFTLVTTLSTSATGTASTIVKPTKNTQYEWQYAGDANHASATSATQTITVTQVISATATPAKAKHGKIVAIWGTVKPKATGRTVTIQVQKHGKWVKVGTAKVKKQKLPNHKKQVGYVLKLTESKKGTYTFRAKIAATATNGAGTSKTVKVKFS